MSLGIGSNITISGSAESSIGYILRPRIEIGQGLDQTRRKIFIQQKLHAATVSSLRSRSAANARLARMSSSVR